MNASKIKNLSYRIWVPDGIAIGSPKHANLTHRDIMIQLTTNAFTKAGKAPLNPNGDILLFEGFEPPTKEGLVDFGVFLKSKAREIIDFLAKIKDRKPEERVLKPFFDTIPAEHTFTAQSIEDMVKIINERLFPDYGITDKRFAVEV